VLLLLLLVMVVVVCTMWAFLLALMIFLRVCASTLSMGVGVCVSGWCFLHTWHYIGLDWIGLH